MKSLFVIVICLACGQFPVHGQPVKAGDPVPVNGGEYDRFIAVKGGTADYVLAKLKQYGALHTGKKTTVAFGLAGYGPWQILKCPDDLSFYDYHNLAGWLTGTGKEAGRPGKVIAFAFHKTAKDKSYYAFVDPANAAGDTLIGVFDNGTGFSIYLPEAFAPAGNMTAGPDRTPGKGVRRCLIRESLATDAFEDYDSGRPRRIEIDIHVEKNGD